MSFAYPYLLYLLLMVPALLGLWLWARLARKHKLRRYGNPAQLERLMPAASKYTPAVKITLELLALTSIIIAVARPQAGQKEEVENTRGIEVMIAFDVSRSMLASSTDDPSGVSRLQRAKYILNRLVDKLDNDKVGLIVFAGEAYTQLPITTDFLSARMYIDELSTDMVATQGTAIGSAIEMSLNAFSPDKEVNKAIIVITDGENHEGDAIEMAEIAKKEGVEVDVIGVGSLKGAPIPVNPSRGEFLKDQTGAPVTTFLNEQMAKDIAKAGGGEYINGSGNKAVDQLISKLDSLKKSDHRHVSYKASAEQFPVFAWIALILLVADCFIMPRKISWRANISFFSKDKATATDIKD